MTFHPDNITLADPYWLRMRAFIKERFPFWGQGMLIISYFSSNQFLAQILLQPQQPVHYTWNSLLGALTLMAFFFHLRVFDEHKDYVDDCRYFPERVLQRGVVTLRELRVLAGIAIGWEILMGVLLGPAVLTAVLAGLLYSVLMLKEFFVKAWLKQHFLLYAGVHMLIMPWLAMVVFSFATQRYFWEAPGWYWVYAFVGFFVCFNWEIARKIRSPEEEREGVETYTKIFGTYGAAYMVLGVRVVDTLLVSAVGWHLGLSPWFYSLLGILYLVCLAGFFQYRFQTNPRTAKRMEFYAGMYIIAFDLLLAVEILRRQGMAWYQP